MLCLHLLRMIQMQTQIFIHNHILNPTILIWIKSLLTNSWGDRNQSKMSKPIWIYNLRVKWSSLKRADKSNRTTQTQEISKYRKWGQHLLLLIIQAVKVVWNISIGKEIKVFWVNLISRKAIARSKLLKYNNSKIWLPIWDSINKRMSIQEVWCSLRKNLRYWAARNMGLIGLPIVHHQTNNTQLLSNLLVFLIVLMLIAFLTFLIPNKVSTIYFNNNLKSSFLVRASTFQIFKMLQKLLKIYMVIKNKQNLIRINSILIHRHLM